MNRFPTPVVVVSKCLGFDRCRYNGQVLSDVFVEQLKKFVKFKPVCPEMEIGLGVPRDPIRIISLQRKRILFQPASGNDVTEAMTSFTKNYLDSIGIVDGFILKSRSPSCGVKDVKIYRSRDKEGASTKDAGFFGKEVLRRFPGLAIEDEGRLSNFSIREHFLTKLFTLARFGDVKKAHSMKALVTFHANNKMLLLGYNQSQMRMMGRIVANLEKIGIDKVLATYELGLHKALSRLSRPTAQINVLHHIFGGFSDKLSAEEKKLFLDSVEEYRDERIPLSALIFLARSYAVRFKSEYLLSQSFLYPYPPELMKTRDSGKGRV